MVKYGDSPPGEGGRGATGGEGVGEVAGPTEGQISPSEVEVSSEPTVSHNNVLPVVEEIKPIHWYRFKKGQSGNPKGRPKTSSKVRTMAYAEALKSISTLVELRDNGRSEKVRIEAAKALISWGVGTPRPMKEFKEEHDSGEEMSDEELESVLSDAEEV